MSKVLKGIGLVVILVALILSVAFAPSAALASTGGWGIVTKTDANPNPNPAFNYSNIWGSTGEDPTRFYGWCSWNSSYTCGLSYSNGSFTAIGSFAYTLGSGYWIHFTAPHITQVDHTYSHFYQDYIYRPEQIVGGWDPINCQWRPGWNLVGSPYGFTGQFDTYNNPVFLTGTPMQCFEFSLDGNAYYPFGQVKSLGWITYAYWWNCMYMDPITQQEVPQYRSLEATDQAPRGHGFWIKANTMLYMRIARPVGILPYPTGYMANGPMSFINTGSSPIGGLPPIP